jgi:hypothetical protein
MRFLGVLTILAAILTTLFGRTIASWMRANVFLIFCHKSPLLSGELLFVILRLGDPAVKQSRTVCALVLEFFSLR